MDKFSRQKRSLIMSHIKGKGTKPEKMVFEVLDAYGIKYEKHYKVLGNPDVVISDKKIVLFIDGDFWHGWNFAKRKSNLPLYWVNKIQKNINRDRRIRAKLRKDGWIVVRIWEHKVLRDTKKSLDKVIKLLI